MVRYVSLPKKNLPSSPALCLNFLRSAFFYVFPLFCKTFSVSFNLWLMLSATFPHLFLHFTFVCLFISVFPFHNLFNLSPSQTINRPNHPPGATCLSLYISPPISCSSACWSHLMLCLCLFLFSLILPLHLSLQQLCVEYKLHTERMSCDTTFTTFTLIDACLLSCMCLLLLCLTAADQYP